MNSCRTFVLSIVALFAVVSLSAHGEQMAAAANNRVREPWSTRMAIKAPPSWAIASYRQMICRGA